MENLKERDEEMDERMKVIPLLRNMPQLVAGMGWISTA